MNRWIVMLAAGLTGMWAYAEEPRLRVVATTGMVADLVRGVGGDRVIVDQLMGPGVDPHLYKPTAQDARRLSEGAVIFYSGLMLEGRMADLFARLGRGGRKVYAVTEGLPENRLLEPPEFEGHFDPHVWFDVGLWAETVPVVVEALAEADPGGADEYRRRGAGLKEKLLGLDRWVREQLATIPEARRVLVTSHDAYNYFGRAYGFRVVALQGVSTISEASLSDVAELVDLIRKQGVPAVFVETSVNPAAIRRVAEDAGVRIGGELFSDALGAPGEMRGENDTGTYEGIVRANVSAIVEALK